MKEVLMLYLPYGSCKKVSEDVGVSRAYVSMIISGKRKNDNILKTLLKIAIENKKNVVRNQESVESLLNKLSNN